MTGSANKGSDEDFFGLVFSGLICIWHLYRTRYWYLAAVSHVFIFNVYVLKENFIKSSKV